MPGLTAMRAPQTGSSPRPPIGDIRITPYAAEDLGMLAPLTAPGFTGLLSEAGGGDAASGLCHLVAWVGEIPAGLLMSRGSEDHPDAQELMSLMVLPLLRRQGVATRLLSAWKTRMGEAGRETLVAQWSDHLPRVQDFAALLAQDGWEKPARARLRMTFHVSDRHEALPLGKGLRQRLDRSGITLRSLADLAPGQVQAFEAAARNGVADGRIPGWAAPDRWLAKADRAVSQVLQRADGSVSGWLLCQRQAALQRWMVPVGWASPAVPARVAMLAAMVRLLECLEAEHGPQATLILQPTTAAGGKVCDLLDRHFRPNALWSDRLMESRLRLG